MSPNALMFPFLAFLSQPPVKTQLTESTGHIEKLENSFPLHGGPILYLKNYFPSCIALPLKNITGWLPIASQSSYSSIKPLHFHPKMRLALHFNKTWNVNVNKYCLLIISNRNFIAYNYFVNKKVSATNDLCDLGHVITPMSWLFHPTLYFCNSKYFN